LDVFRSLTISVCVLFIYTSTAGASRPLTSVSEQGATRSGSINRDAGVPANTEAHGARDGTKLAYVAKVEKHSTSNAHQENFDLEKFLDSVQLQAKHCYAWASVELPRFYRATLPKLGIRAQSAGTQATAPPETSGTKAPARTNRANTLIDTRHKTWLVNDGRLKIVTDR